MSEATKTAMGDIGTTEEIKTLAAQDSGPAERPAVNAHIHLPPNFSAFESVEEAVRLAAEQDVRVLGVSNYYDYSVYDAFTTQAKSRGIFPLYGLEIICLVREMVESGAKVNDPGNPGKFYYCGKGITKFTEMTERAEELIAKIRANDDKRMAEMTEKIGAAFAERGVNVQLTAADAIQMIVKRHGSDSATVTLQERHIAQAYQEALFTKFEGDARGKAVEKALGTTSKDPQNAVAVQGEIRSCLMKSGKPAFVEETFVNLEEATELILELGGIPCYPTLADGIKPLCEFETPIDKMVESLRGLNVHMAELIPIRNTPEMLLEYAENLRENGMAVVAGTEHNTLDLIPMEPTCLKGAPVPEAAKALFWEGACVVAGHQYMVMHGQPGFVDTKGNPNPDYNNADERIRAYAAIGAAVIGRYFEKNQV